MSTAWSIFIIVLVIINVGGCGWLIWWTMHMHTEDKAAGDDSTGHTWDGDLKEYNNPLPKWWLNIFYLSIIFTVVYLVLYPGFGNFAGVLGWSQEGQYDQEVTASDAKLSGVYEAFRGKSLEELVTNPDALKIGRNTFLNVCAACHGSDGRGAKGFPNLTDDDWLVGNNPETVLNVVSNGRLGIMPALGAVVGEEGIDSLIAWMRSKEGDTSPEVAAGMQKYLTSGCIGCHGMKGEGNPALGAPDLRDDIWLHGERREDIADVINNGRSSEMPAHLELLGEDRVRLVTAYVLSLSQ
jgi:cytochrome c oxidase cbb3-type subunit 3